MPNGGCLTTRELSELVKVHPGTLRKWARQGQGPPCWRSWSPRGWGRIHYDESKLRAWLAANSHPRRVQS